MKLTILLQILSIYSSAFASANSKGDHCSTLVIEWVDEINYDVIPNYSFCLSRAYSEDECRKFKDEQEDSANRQHVGAVFEACKYVGINGEFISLIANSSQSRALKAYARSKYASIPRWLQNL